MSLHLELNNITEINFDNGEGGKGVVTLHLTDEGISVCIYRNGTNDSLSEQYKSNDDFDENIVELKKLELGTIIHSIAYGECQVVQSSICEGISYAKFRVRAEDGTIIRLTEDNRHAFTKEVIK